MSSLLKGNIIIRESSSWLSVHSSDRALVGDGFVPGAMWLASWLRLIGQIAFEVMCGVNTAYLSVGEAQAVARRLVCLVALNKVTNARDVKSESPELISPRNASRRVLPCWLRR